MNTRQIEPAGLAAESELVLCIVRIAAVMLRIECREPGPIPAVERVQPGGEDVARGRVR